MSRWLNVTLRLMSAAFASLAIVSDWQGNHTIALYMVAWAILAQLWSMAK